MEEPELRSMADEQASRNHSFVEEESEIAGNEIAVNQVENGSEKNGYIQEESGEGTGLCRRRYSRSEMEALRSAQGGDAQSRRWKEIYGSLAPIVSRELDQIFEFKKGKQGSRRVNRNQRSGGNNGAACISSSSSETCAPSEDDAADTFGKFFPSVNESVEEITTNDYACGDFVLVDDNGRMIEDASQDDEDSDNEHVIQRLAFYVEGDPDFESGPPQDGLEYLRRVRWEAAQIPKVKVAKLGERQLQKEQTPYMPNIPDIARCPQHLLPSRQWEDAFLRDFSQLRQALSQLESSSSVSTDHSLSATSVSEDSKEATRNWPKLTSPPMLSAVLKMQSVSRVSMLRNRISSLQTASTLSRESCLWLFALCAAVDTPFDADTSASLRCLLRKCSSLLARKENPDDEVVMLNMLVTIAGRYFGQAGD